MFIPLYEFDIQTGEWLYKDKPGKPITLDFDQVINAHPPWKRSSPSLELFLEDSVEEAESIIATHGGDREYKKFDKEVEDVIFFYAVNVKG